MDNKRVTHTVFHLDINAPQLEKILNRKSSNKLRMKALVG